MLLRVSCHRRRAYSPIEERFLHFGRTSPTIDCCDFSPRQRFAKLSATASRNSKCEPKKRGPTHILRLFLSGYVTLEQTQNKRNAHHSRANQEYKAQSGQQPHARAVEQVGQQNVPVGYL